MGNDLFGPRKHFFPQRFIIMVLWRTLGFSLFHPFQGTFFRV
jgi:hypothetical protein